MSEDKLSLASQVCLDKVHTHCQAENSQDLLRALFKIAKIEKYSFYSDVCQHDSE